ncbi:tRNA threonylcarbamoyladenosine biosynthesis protein TsaE [Sphingomonas palmae]|uniref:tRNA threonylcarbamoyladenosine biosynthesis protein TsaE n=1 Tax=Sphingomonas palmae TaxID=1855283 RepID=A0A1H7I8B8_9SPHN|nr:tRNA (adenosine(37)-N6)-threonylcarbamoyltransferase complex ATPase subunit type 1 TsaE [Sphingomonas palmae]SEK58082.1 tRNA threonylcarbamoyladenosine biosynthesis protein TsaE [Sphingomonas palmae]
MSGEIYLPDAAATEALGRSLASVLRAGDVVLLSGSLGMGKTSFARGVLSALGLAGEAPSPTFAIIQPYAPPEVRLPVVHADLYRIEDASELEELGLDDALYDSALLVEWPERVPASYWRDPLRLAFANAPAGGRALTWDASAAWKRRWRPT